MRQAWVVTGCVAGAVLVASSGWTQTPPAAPTGSVVVTNPTYTSLEMEILVNKPVAEVWTRVGKYCDIGEWLRTTCTMTSGKEGELGAVRSIGAEVLVAKTEYSYTYTQPPREGRPYNLYHGTLEARAVNATTTRLLYSLVYDNSMLADDTAREADKTRRRTTFTNALQNMKILAEGGALPPAPARGAGRGN